MHKYMLATLVAFALVLSSCADSNQPTSPQQTPSVAAQKTTSTWSEWSTTIYNPCCDEDITLTAKYHYVSNGTSRASVNLANLEGVGESGSIYHGSARASQTVNEDGTSRYMEHWSLATSSGCGFTIMIKYHYDLDANGDPVFVLDTYEINCN
jgi:hypothetical protein